MGMRFAGPLHEGAGPFQVGGNVLVGRKLDEGHSE